MKTMVSLRLDEEVIDDLDILVQLGYGVNRSDAIREAVRRYTNEILANRKKKKR